MSQGLRRPLLKWSKKGRIAGEQVPTMRSLRVRYCGHGGLKFAHHFLAVNNEFLIEGQVADRAIAERRIPRYYCQDQENTCSQGGRTVGDSLTQVALR